MWHPPDKNARQARQDARTALMAGSMEPGEAGAADGTGSPLSEVPPVDASAPSMALTTAWTTPNGLNMPAVPPSPSGNTTFTLRLFRKKLDGSHPTASVVQAIMPTNAHVVIVRPQRFMTSLETATS